MGTLLAEYLCTHRRGAVEELIKGQARDAAGQQQILLGKPTGDHDAPEELLVKLLTSYTESLSHVLMNSCKDCEVSQNPNQVRSPSGNQRAVDPGEGRKRPVAKDRMVVAKRRCTHKHDQGCQATEPVLRIQEASHMYPTNDFGHRTCRSSSLNNPFQNPLLEPYRFSFSSKTISTQDSEPHSLSFSSKTISTQYTSPCPSSASSVGKECGEETVQSNSLSGDLPFLPELPKFVAFNSLSSRKYLCPSGTDSNMKFDAVVVDSKGVKHKVVKAECDNSLVHIRCCDTGKYWSWGGKHNRIIVAQADQPQEDTTKKACTLIKPFLNTKDGVTVFNLQCGDNGSWPFICGYKGCLVAGETVEDFIISDWELLTPKQPNQPQGSVGSIGNTTIAHDVSIENTNRGGIVLMGNTNIGGDVSLDTRGVSMGNLSIGPRTRIEGSSSIGNMTIGGGVSVGNSNPNF